MTRKLEDDLGHYRFYMGDTAASLPPEIPASAELELPPPEGVEVVKTVGAPYADFVAMVGRIALKERSTLILDPWRLWASLDAKQRKVESTESALAKAMRRVHSGVTFTVNAAGMEKIPSANLPLRLYRGAVCCLASESDHFTSCLAKNGGYRGAIPTLIASGALALVKGSILERTELRKRIWLYLNHDASGLAVARPAYGDWKRAELIDAFVRIEKTLGLPIIGTFHSETATRLGIEASAKTRSANSDGSNALFRTAWFTMRPEWRAPYTDGMEVRRDEKNNLRQVLVAERWYPIDMAKLTGTSTAGATRAPGERVLRVRITVKNKTNFVLYKVLEQSHVAGAFGVDTETPTEFKFRGASLLSDLHPELRLHNDVPMAFVRGGKENMNDLEVPYKIFVDDKAYSDRSLAAIMAAIRAYNTNPEIDPIEYIEED